MAASSYGWLTLAFPLGGSVLIGLLYRVLSDKAAGWIGSAAIFGAFLSALGGLFAIQDLSHEARQIVSGYEYANVLGVDFDMSILVDPLSIFMALVVSGVSFLIHVYSTAYMESDRGYKRFFAYMNFFVFSMLLLVLAGNFAVLIIGWAFVGAASYLLISYWYRRDTATAAGIKAFVINVVGDIGLVIGAFLIWRETNTLDFLTSFERAQDSFQFDGSTITIACIMLLVGAFAKSAQLPLHTWLPDAMEGPTPVSALIHAATMVTAGVYLIARMHPFFEIAPDAALIGAIIGCATLLMAATIALVQTDLKRVIAYSTMSQIGYMIMGVSAAAYSAGLFHLMTHAFFKALLFMAAGSVIAAMAGVQDINRMGGFKKAMPFTYATFLVGALALAGFPLLSGFFSKDEVLAFTAHRGGAYEVLAILGYIGAALTAFYALRMVYIVFHGPPVEEARQLIDGHLAHGEHVNPVTGEHEDTEVGFPGERHHIAERETPMKIAMGTLALLAIIGGYLQVPSFSHVIENFLEPTFENSKYFHEAPSNSSQFTGLAIGALIALAGIALAAYLYRVKPGTTVDIRDRLSAVHRVLWNKYYFDQLIDWMIVRPTRAIGGFAQSVIERFLVNGLLIGGTTGATRAGTAIVRAAQTGFLRVYALSIIFGAVAIAIYFYSAAD